MYKFFVNRPIVSMMISIVMVIVAIVAMLSLPTAQFPNITLLSKSKVRRRCVKRDPSPNDALFLDYPRNWTAGTGSGQKSLDHFNLDENKKRDVLCPNLNETSVR